MGVTDNTGQGTDYWLLAVPNQLPGVGMQWSATESIPTQSPFAPDGLLGVAQIVTAYVNITASNGMVYVSQANGLTGLDGAFPYMNVESAPSYGAADTLGLDLSAANAISATVADSFSDYLMYLPPSYGSQGTSWVPLAFMQWSTQGVASEPDGGWANFTGSAGPINAPTSFTTPYSQFPNWSLTISAAELSQFNPA